ncbi:hypothetical protein Ahy_A06g030242 [Arachis hypogaea]|uniref:SWIM-type domain-containing protein n=1 Tax=Arachis hypogaea TaxID=3818 RepID=A0A445CVM9_ARAHY|nr:hypothetical protein Ahy_A06g030242 [Arachis hypogaea]
MRTITKNKVKLNNHTGVFTPVIKSRLEKVRKESKYWKPIWTEDNGYKNFEVHGHPTNHVVDLGKRLCTCQFWMLTGIPCVHTCAALSQVNKPPEDFCHRLLTMESYRKTYNHHINPIPGQPLWEYAEECNRLHAPKIKRKPGKLQMKRRMDADEKGGGGSKKSKANPKSQSNNGDNSTEIGQATSDAEPVEIDISQPTASDVENSQKDHGIKRPSKLSPRRRSSPLATSIPVNPMQGASSGNATRFFNYIKFIPTSGFKAPRKKN